MALDGFNSSVRCTDDVCRRVAAMEPYLPIAPPFMPDSANPCIAPRGGVGPPVCLPYVHIISGWHMFSDESLGWLKKVKEIDTSRGGGGCFDDWGEKDIGAERWVTSWGSAPPTGGMITTHCNKLLTWYPAFAGRYTIAWGKSYGPCKEEYVKKPGDYYKQYLWPVCRPRALKAHDDAMGTGGAGHEATPPFVMRALYGPKVRIISALGHLVDQLTN